MQRIAKFDKVSRQRFVEDIMDVCPEFNEEVANEVYDEIKLPKRATTGSAGYDFYAPIAIDLKPGETLKVPTGIRSTMKDGWVLMCFPRSGLGFKYRLQLDNTVGVIDADYAYSDNEGHIFLKITNDTNKNKTISLKAGDAFAQGVFLPFGITEDDEADGIRNGGLGSTSL